MSVGNAHLYKKYQSQYILFQDAAVSTGGKFQFPNIPAGSYELFAYSAAASGSSSWNVRQTIEVGSSDLDLALRADYLGAISGRVLFESERPASGGMPLLLLRNEEDTTLRIQPGFDGNFSLSRLPMGRYEMSSGSSEYVAAYLSDPAGQRLPLTLEINSSEPIHRDIVLSRAVSVIEGTVNKAGTPQVGSFVLLMPQDPSQRWAYRVD